MKHNNATATTKNAFTDLMRNLETAYTTDPTSETTATALTDLATACALSVLKKCIDLGYNSTLVSVRNDLNRTRHNLETMSYLNNRTDITETVTRYNKDGEETTETVILDRTAYDRTFSIIRELDGDGYDLVQTASLKLWEELARQTANGETVNLETVYTVRKLSKRVYIDKNDPCKFDNVETTPIQEVYKAVRRHINDGRAMSTDPRNGYLYLADVVTDAETDTTETVFRRLPKQFDLVSNLEIRGGNKGITTVTMSTNPATVDRYDRIISDLKTALTDRQLTVLKYRLQGFGYDPIAVKLGVSKNAIVKTVKAIQKKCIDLGYNPTATATDNE